MNVEEIINTFTEFAQNHPYLALAIVLFIIGALIGKKFAIVFYILGALALLKDLSLFDVFVNFLKEVPSMLEGLLSVFGG